MLSMKGITRVLDFTKSGRLWGEWWLRRAVPESRQFDCRVPLPKKDVRYGVSTWECS